MCGVRLGEGYGFGEGGGGLVRWPLRARDVELDGLSKAARKMWWAWVGGVEKERVRHSEARQCGR